MAIQEFEGKSIRVIDFSDALAAERVIEFRYIEAVPSDSFMAIVIPDGEGWAAAKVSLDPRNPEVSVGIMSWALNVAQEMVK
ncbi:hypothetical protein R8Z50_27395 [Longispora sp. K20-0274]|uniref:hypothetical protein n=1 Tax=Longispora sp. K20-0274 TaxID=3088255 RepID=UPI00399BC0E2